MILKFFYGSFTSRNFPVVIGHYKSQSRPVKVTLRTFMKYSNTPSQTLFKYFKWPNIYQYVTEQNQIQLKKFYHEAKRISLNSSSKGLSETYRSVTQDLCIYMNENSKFFKYVSLFSISQCMFWGYLSYISYSTMIDCPVTAKEEEDAKKSWEEGMPKFIPFWRQMNLGKYKNAISIFSATVGVLAVCLTCLYTTKSVRRIILKKGGENVMIQFFGLIGNGRQQIIPLSNISANTGRRSGGSYIILKLKGMKFYVILDSKGSFPNTELFDHTVGVRRHIK